MEKIGEVHQSNQNYPQAIEAYEKAIQKLKSTTEYESLADLQIKMVTSYYQILNYPKALENYQLAQDIYDSQQNTKGKILALRKIGEVYFHLNEMEKVLNLIDEIIPLGNSLNSKKELAYAYAWKGNIYMNLRNLEESRLNYAKSIELRKEIGDEERLADDYSNLALGYQLEKYYQNALKFHNEVKSLNDKTQYKFGQILYYKDMGMLLQNAPDDILRQMDVAPQIRFETSLEYEKIALRLAEEIDDKPQITYILSIMKTAYEKLGDFKSAYEIEQRLKSMTESMLGQEIKAELARVETQHYFEAKEAEIQAIHQKKQSKLRLQYSIAISLFVILAITGFLLYYFTKMKKKKEKEVYLAKEKIMKLEKDKMETELKKAKMEMQFFIENLNEKNSLIDEISAELNKLQNTLDYEKQGMQTKLIEIKNSVILTDDDWKTFLQRFEIIYPDFIPYIKSEYPKITNAELRYLMLLKIGLSNKDMADTLGVSLNTIHVTWKRLREKLGISKEEAPQNLLKYLEQKELSLN